MDWIKFITRTLILVTTTSIAVISCNDNLNEVDEEVEIVFKFADILANEDVITLDSLARLIDIKSVKCFSHNIIPYLNDNFSQLGC